MHAFHETIYTYLFALLKGELRKGLISYFRQQKKLSKNSEYSGDQRRKSTDMISIHELFKEAEERILPGDWEGDLRMGKDHHSAISSIVERTTRTLNRVPLKKKDATSVRKAFAKELKTLASQMAVLLNDDRSKKMAEYKLFTKST